MPPFIPMPRTGPGASTSTVIGSPMVGPDGIATLKMQIATYGGRADDIPADWRRNFGIASHNIEVDLRDGRIHARDR
jgi:hypothetical protein